MTDPSSRERIVVLVVLGSAALALAGAPAVAAFYADPDPAQGNTLQGGTLDVKLTENGPTNGHGSTTDETSADTVSDTWEDTSHDTLGADNATNTLVIENDASTLSADAVDLAVSFSENDGSSDDGDPANTASTIEVTAFSYAGTDLLGELVDENGNSQIDVEDLTLGDNPTTLSNRAGIAAGGSAEVTLALSGTADLIDGVDAGDGIDITLTVDASAASFVDTDQSVHNTIQYA